MPLPRYYTTSIKKKSMKRDQYRLTLSRELKLVLTRINDSISKKLLFFDDNKDYGFPVSYIDITDKDTITYTPSKKIIELFANHNKASNLVWATSRNEQKIGRFISRVLGEDSNKIEEFVNKYKAEIKSINNLDNFRIVKSDELVKYYRAKYYSEGGGSLNKSCMRHDHCQEFFNFYKINPDKVSMVILYENEKNYKILGRALLWEVDEPKIKLLDRIYSSNDSDQNLFIKLAIKNGWYYKKTQRFDERKFVDDKGNDCELKCKIYLKSDKHRYFPYLDTFYYYDREHHYITNDINEFKTNKYTIKLRSTDGTEQGNEYFVYDSYNKDYLKTEDTIYCEIGDDRISKKDAIIVNGVYSLPTKVRFSEYDGKIYPKNDVIWSSTHSTFISKKNSFKVFFDEKSTRYDFIHSDLKGESFEYSHDKDSYFIKELLIRGIDKRYYLKNEYDEEKVKNKLSKNRFSKAGELNDFFDEFINKLSKKEEINIDYGTFGSTENRWT